MTCLHCGQPATVTIIEVSNGAKREVQLCEHCAVAQAMPQPTILPPSVIKESLLPQVVSELLQNGEITCSGCGISFNHFRQHGRLGCPSCYHSFRKHLDGLLDRIHGDAHHVGRRPGQHDPNLLITLQRHQLLGELRRAVTSELYEKAAQLRDQLRALEQQQRSNDAI